jgi:hypothetical protein
MDFAAAGVTAQTPAHPPTREGVKRCNGDSHLDGESRSKHTLRQDMPHGKSNESRCEKEAGFERILEETGIKPLRSVRVEVVDGRVKLEGRVPSFYAKQLAQEALRPYAIGLKIDNRLAVDLP